MQEVKTFLETALNKKVREEGKTLKVNVEQLNGVAIYNLNYLNLTKFENVVDILEVKRSGVGLVVIVTLK